MDDGLYMKGCFIRLVSRERRDDEGRKKRKYYLGVSIPSGAFDVALSPDEFDRLAQLEEAGKLKRGCDVMVGVEAFGFRDRVYFRADGDAHIISEFGEVIGASDKASAGSAAVSADALSKMEAAVAARVGK